MFGIIPIVSDLCTVGARMRFTLGLDQKNSTRRQAGAIDEWAVMHAGKRALHLRTNHRKAFARLLEKK